MDRKDVIITLLGATAVGSLIVLGLSARKLPHTPNANPSEQRAHEDEVDHSPQRQQLLSRRENDRRGFLRYTILHGAGIQARCSCDQCNPTTYFNWPFSCKFHHSPEDIVIVPNQNTELIPQYDIGPYEALTLARRVIAYFSRPEPAMGPEQLQGLRDFRNYMRDNNLMFNLGLVVADSEVHNEMLQDIARHLNKIFFFDAITNLGIKWNAQAFDEHKELNIGWTTTFSASGQSYTHIVLHPARRLQLPDEYVRNGQSLAEERLGTILYEMIHGFLFQYACELCTACADNVKNHGGHGRAWQLIAKAVEDEASRLLGTEVYLGRLDSLDMKPVREQDVKGMHSLHDLEVYGFLDRESLSGGR